MKHVIAIIAIYLTLYAIAGFILWNWNPATWPEGHRSMLVGMCITMSLLYPLGYASYKDF